MDLRSKTRTLEGPFRSVEDLPAWNYDGSSTNQAPGQDSEVILSERYTATPSGRPRWTKTTYSTTTGKTPPCTIGRSTSSMDRLTSRRSPPWRNPSGAPRPAPRYSTAAATSSSCAIRTIRADGPSRPTPVRPRTPSLPFRRCRARSLGSALSRNTRLAGLNNALAPRMAQGWLSGSARTLLLRYRCGQDVRTKHR